MSLAKHQKTSFFFHVVFFFERDEVEYFPWKKMNVSFLLKIHSDYLLDEKTKRKSKKKYKKKKKFVRKKGKVKNTQF